MIDARHRRPPAFWLILIGGAIVATLLSLSIHVVMLQLLGVSFPDRSAVGKWALLFDGTLAALALLIFYERATPRLARFPLWLRALIVAAVYGMLKEVFRGIAMNVVVNTAVLFDLAQGLLPIPYCIVIGGLVVSVGPRLRGIGARLIGALVIAALMLFVVRPLLTGALGQLLQAIAYLDHADVYPFPYGWHVLGWAYVTYLEPVIAGMIIALLVWPELSAGCR